jgi:hypothetical protein
MSIVDHLRRALFASGLTVVMMSILLDGQFASDVAIPVPEPSSFGLLATAGVGGIVVSLIRRRKK